MAKRHDRYNLYSDGSVKHTGFTEGNQSFNIIEDKHHRVYKVNKRGKKTLTSETINDETFNYDTSKRKMHFTFDSTIKLILMFTLSVILFSWGSRGYLDSAYLSKKTTLTYNQLVIENGVVVNQTKTEDLYDYDWIAKLNQLKGLKNIFTIPDVKMKNSLFTNDNLQYVELLARTGFIYPTYIDKDKYDYMVSNLRNGNYTRVPGGYLLQADMNVFSNIRFEWYLITSLFNQDKKQEIVYASIDLSDKTFVTNYMRMWSNYFKYVSYDDFVDKFNNISPLLLFTKYENGRFTWRSNLIKEFTTPQTNEQVYKIIDYILYPLTIVSNTIYDLGIIFNFLLNW